MPTQEMLSAVRTYLKSLDRQPRSLFRLTTKTSERWGLRRIARVLVEALFQVTETLL